ncbi:MAG: tRNA pseudouridine(55) synthase TruB [Pseudomonadota bacterium]
MARRRRSGRRVDGWLVVDKPLGLSSSAVVNKLRWALQAQKAGHSGTLDPLATGCLAIAFGEATKTVPVAQEGDKRYHFTVRWGAETETDDLEGAVTTRSERRPELAEIEAVLPVFRGEIAQIPPAFSAVKLDGARAYALARRGVEPALEARPIQVERLEVMEHYSDEAVFEMTCGKGGYVRSIARDLGRALGCYGHVSTLRRLATGPFDLTRSIAFDGVDALRERPLPPELLPLEAGLHGLTRIDCDAEAARHLRHGRAIPASLAVAGQCWAAMNGQAVALGQVRDGIFHPDRVFAAPEETADLTVPGA